MKMGPPSPRAEQRKASKAMRQPLDCGGSTPLSFSQALAPQRPTRSEVIHHRQPIDLEAPHRPSERIRRLARKPARRTPRILLRLLHHPMVHGILMHVPQPRRVEKDTLRNELESLEKQQPVPVFPPPDLMASTSTPTLNHGAPPDTHARPAPLQQGRAHLPCR